MARILAELEDYPKFLVTYDSPNAQAMSETIRTHLIGQNPRNRAENIVSWFRVLRVVSREEPDVVITTGSGMAVSALIWARLTGRAAFFFESFARINQPSRFGRIAALLASSTFYQWRTLKPYYGRRGYIGSLYDFAPDPIAEREVGEGVFVCLGTHEAPMTRVVEELDRLAGIGYLPRPARGQIGPSRPPRNFETVSSMQKTEYLSAIRSARVVVCHGGSGTLIEAIRARRSLVIVPRLPQYGEHQDCHQLELAEALEALGFGRVVLRVDELETAISEAKPPEKSCKAPDQADLREFLLLLSSQRGRRRSADGTSVPLV